MVKYHFRTKTGPEVGPIDAEEFRQRVEAGEIVADTTVWRSGLINWTNYAGLRAFEEEETRKKAAPPPLPVEAASPAAGHHGTAPQPAKFVKCAACNQEWPESLTALLAGKPLCANCQRRKAEDPKYAQLVAKAVPQSSPASKAGSVDGSNSAAKGGLPPWLAKALTIIVVPLVCCGILFGVMWLRYVTTKNAVSPSSMKMSALPIR